MKIPLNYSLNNNLENLETESSSEEEKNHKAEWLVELKRKNEELLEILRNWADAYERKEIESNAWVYKGVTQTDEENRSELKMFKPEQITEFIEHNIINWIKEPTEHNKGYFYALEDFEKVFEKICHINSGNTTPKGFSSDVRHLSRFLEIVDSNIKSCCRLNIEKPYD